MAARLTGLLGHRIGHSRSPAMHNAAFLALGLDWTYRLFDVAPEVFGRAVGELRALGAAGANVTIPHKVAAAALCDALDDGAAATGAANALVFEAGRLRGANTDIAGFRRSVEADLGLPLSGAAVVVLGVGGAARAVGAAAAAAGARVVRFVHRAGFEEADAAAIVARLGPRFGGVRWEAATGATASVLGDAGLLVNATPLGWKGEAAPADPALLPPGAAVLDLVYGRVTPLMAAARARGLRAADGETMLVAQAAESFRLWTGREAPIDVMRAAFRADAR